ncbi:hypothetical protein PybrP1_012915 [[Pythium] brassicae (nom. inval.)]|nr:hypothetical protein PybrP1_012915 [[Pythium] brassicae (nom. inval.)]
MPAHEERIALLLDKTTDFDKDERYMATSDLCTELNKDTELGPYFEPKVCAAVLKQLDDKSNDVQSIAVKCLGILVTKVQETQVADICAKLSDLILTGKAELRDIYAIGLKTILTDVSSATGAAVAAGLCARLLKGLAPAAEQAVKAETLDILTDLLRRFGHDIATEHDTVMQLLIAQLNDASPLVRKRATACVGSLGVMASDALLSRLVEHLIQGIQAASAGTTSSSSAVDVRTFIQTIGTLSRTAGHRLGHHLHAIVPILTQFCGAPDDEALQNEAASELRENCFQAFEAFVVRCHNEITPHVPAILTLVMAFINDDDDTSWKVRRAGLRVLTAIITTRPELLELLYERYSQQLIARFKEREENVRIDVFSVFAELLRATRRALPATGAAAQAPTTCLAQVRARLKVIVLAANKQFGAKASVSSRCAVIAVLSELASVERGQLGDYLDVLLPNLLRAAEDKHSDLKLDALVFLRLLLDTHPAEPFRAHIRAIVHAAVHCAQGDWYKTVAKSLGLIESLVRVISELDDAAATSHAVPLYEAVLPSLKAHDIDQEIKESAISSIGQIVAALGDELGARVAEVYPLLMERLNNEITRVQSMKAIGAIARSPLALDLSAILADCVVALSQLLRQQSRTLKQATLETLTSLVVHKGAQIPQALLADVVAEASSLVVDSDLQLCRAGIVLVANTLRVAPGIASTDALLLKALPNALALCRSAMLQGATLEALKGLFAQLTALDAPGSSFADLFGAFMGSSSASASSSSTATDLSKHAVLNLARCVAAVCVASTEANQQRAFATFVDDITGSAEKRCVVALYCLGEFGRQLRLDGFPDVKATVLRAFAADGEDVKAAAAYALGSMCVGNMAEYLETIMRALELGDATSYLLLSALREVIADHAASPQHGFAAYVARVLPVLRALSAREEEGVRNMVAECLGKLAVTGDGAQVVPVVAALCAATDSGHSRWTGVTSLKFALAASASEAAVANVVALAFPPFLAALEDADLSVRRAALLALNTGAHHHAHAFAPFVAAPVLPALLAATEIRLERTVDLGPFKHKVDDGLPLRKAAYACVDTLVAQHAARASPQLFARLQAGLRDHDDVQLLAHQLLATLCRAQPGAVVGALELLVEPLEKAATKKGRDEQQHVGTEVERAKDLVRSALRAVDAVSTVRDADAHPKFSALLESLKRNKALASQLEAIRSERESG